MEKEIHTIQEDEIDLKELFKTLWQKRVFIIVFTLIITVLGAVYAFVKTPIYELNATYRIGYIGDKLIDEPKVLEQKLRLVFNVDNKDIDIEKNNPKVTNIKTVKEVENFFKVEIQGYSNSELIKKNKEILEFIKKDYSYKYNEFKITTKNKIKDLEYNLNYAQKIEKEKIKKEKEKIKKELTLNIENEITFLKNTKLKAIENKIKFYSNQLKEFNKSIQRIEKLNKSSLNKDILVNIELNNFRSLAMKTKDKIEDLYELKQNVLLLEIGKLEFKKENLINEDLKKLEVKLDIELPKKIYDLKQKLSKEKRKLETKYFKKTYIEGKVLTNSNPIKPKKKLIVVVSFVTGFILSIFLVFFMQFIRSFKEEVNE